MTSASKLTALTDEERQLLAAYGIKGKMQDNSILDYPEVEQWMKSSEGEKFLSGEKGLCLEGGWKAAKVGYAIQRWFLLAGSQGAVVDLWEFENFVNTPFFVDKYYVNYNEGNSDWERFLQTNIFIENFTSDYHHYSLSPLKIHDRCMVEDFVKNKYFDSDTVILHLPYPLSNSYSNQFEEFINDCFLNIDLWEENATH